MVVVAFRASADPCLSQPVRIHKQRVARAKSDMRSDKSRFHGYPDGMPTNGVGVARVTVGAKHQRRKMPTAGKVHRESVVSRRENAENNCGELIYSIAELLAQHRMQVLQHYDRFRAEGCGGPQRVAGQRGHRGSTGAFSAHVTYEKGPLVMCELKQVVEISSDVVGGGGV